MSFSVKDDSELVKIILNNEHEADMAFREIYNRYHKRIFKFIANSISNFEDCRDVFQQVFLNVYKGLKTYKEKFNFSSWVYKIALNSISNFKRATARNQKFLKEYQKEYVQVYHPDYVEKLFNDRMIRILNEEITKLPEKYRFPLALATTGELKIKEIASMIKITERGTRKRINKAKELLTLNMKKRLKHD